MDGRSFDRARTPGTTVAVRGSVVDVEFSGMLPAVNNRLEVGDDGAVLEVASHVDGRTVRTIALTPTRGLARGDLVKDTGRSLDVPVGRALLGRMLNIFGDVIDGGPPLTDVERRDDSQDKGLPRLPIVL